MKLESSSATHVGQRKDNNEDAYYTSPQAGLFVLCDGMGGHADGHVASQLTVRSIVQFLQSSGGIKGSIEHAHNDLLAQVKAGIGSPGMGTTAVVVDFQDEGSFEFAWVGDSRVYVISGSGMRMLSEDHTFVQAMLNAGCITTEEAKYHPYKSVLMQAVGGEKNNIDVSYGAGRLRDGECILICSDGLVNELDETGINDIITRNEHDLQKAANILVDKANEHGGKDNISVVLVRYLEKED